MLNELRAMRAELKLHDHAGTRTTSITDRERFTHMPLPTGAKRGYWDVTKEVPHEVAKPEAPPPTRHPGGAAG